MAIVAMADAVPDTLAQSSEYNKLIDNIQDLDARLGPVTSANSADSRLDALEAPNASLTVKRTAQQTGVVPSTATLVSWQAADDDSMGFFSAGSPTIVTCKQAGKYAATVQVVWQSEGTGIRWVFVTKNSTDTATGTFLFADGALVCSNASTDIRLAVNDVLRVYVYHNHSANLYLDSVYGGTKLNLRRVGA